MCGIVGCLNPKLDIAEPLGLAMLERVRHRGPDEGYLYLEDNVLLGVRRLAVINPRNGSQPAFNETGEIAVIFNGEIYNHRELRRELSFHGHKLSEGSDAEVIPHAFEEWGLDFPNHLNGDFAIAIWDQRAAQLVLVRDRLGIKPLYYARTKNGLVFGSEIKAIFTHPDVERQLNPEYLCQLFTFWTGLETESPFSGIRQVAAGCADVFDMTGQHVGRRKYWEIPHAGTVPAFQGDFESCQEAFREVMRRSVSLRLQADVPVGTYTSGGVDSSVLNILAYGDLAHRDTQTFSLAFEDQVFDESAYQGLLVQHLGLTANQLRCSREAIYRALPDVIYHAESPLFRTAPVPMYLLSQLVSKQGIKVVLTGEGADEVAWGYDIFREAKIRRFWSRMPTSTLRPQLLKKLYAYLPQFQNPRFFNLLVEFFRSDMEQTSDPLYSHHTRMANCRATHLFLSDELKRSLREHPPEVAMLKSLPTDFSQRSLLEKCQFLEMRTLLHGYLLSSQGDRMLSAHGVEGRFPFLDHHVIEFLAGIPPRHRLRGMQDKAILRETFKADLPREIFSRPKFAFRAPELNAFVKDPDGLVGACFDPSAIKQAGIFDAAAVTRFRERLRQLPADRFSTRDNLAFVQILTTQILHDQFINLFDRNLARSRPRDVTVLRSNSVAAGRVPTSMSSLS